MACTEAQLAANRANAQRSTGPQTEEGKAASRRNAMKHGLAGAGVVLPYEDEAEARRRTTQFRDELGVVGSGVSMILAERFAVLTVRLERSARYEFAATAERTRTAGDAFDEVRRDEAARRFASFLDDPAAPDADAVYALPEGVDLIITALRALRDEGDADPDDRAERFARLVGERPGADLGASVVAEVARLEAYRRTLDHAAIASARAEVVRLALVDEATPGRRYEAAIERSLFRTLRELRLINQAHAAPVPPMPMPIPRPPATAPRPSAPPAPAAASASASAPTETDRAIAAARAELAELKDLARGLGSFGPTPRYAAAATDASTITIANPAPRRQSRYEDRSMRPKLPR